MWQRSSKCDSGSCVEVDLQKPNFHKSSFCDSRDCVEVGFRKSSRSGNADWCVEVGLCSCHQDMVLVRDSKELRFTNTPQVLSFSRSEWDKFLGGLPVRSRV